MASASDAAPASDAPPVSDVPPASGAPAPDSAPVPQIVKKKRTLFRDLAYSAHSPACVGDLYLPRKKDPPYPLVVVVHAGGWMTGDKNDFDSAELCTKLAIVGFAAFNINYRLVGQGGTFPHSIDDVKNAVNFMVANAPQYEIDPKKIGLFGISAGANLALMAAYNADKDFPKGQKNNHLNAPIRAVVAYCPVIDLVSLDKPFVTSYMDDIATHAPDLYRLASPATYIKNAVPTICIHGTGDTLIPYGETKKFVTLLQKNGCEAQFVAIPDGVHLFVGSDKDLSFKPAVEFLGAHFQ